MERKKLHLNTFLFPFSAPVYFPFYIHTISSLKQKTSNISKMSTNSIEKADIVHQEITIDVADAAKAERSHFHAPPTTELIEFQKKMIGPAIGFASFGLSSFLLGLFNAGVLTSVPQVAVGVAFR